MHLNDNLMYYGTSPTSVIQIPLTLVKKKNTSIFIWAQVKFYNNPPKLWTILMMLIALYILRMKLQHSNSMPQFWTAAVPIIGTQSWNFSSETQVHNRLKSDSFLKSSSKHTLLNTGLWWTIFQDLSKRTYKNYENQYSGGCETTILASFLVTISSFFDLYAVNYVGPASILPYVTTWKAAKWTQYSAIPDFPPTFNIIHLFSTNIDVWIWERWNEWQENQENLAETCLEGGL